MCVDQLEITYVCKYTPPTDTVCNGYVHIRAVDTLASLGSASLRQMSGHEFQKSQSDCLTVSTDDFDFYFDFDFDFDFVRS
jgi:hypothetical protein